MQQNSASSFRSISSAKSNSSIKSRSRETTFTTNKLIPELRLWSPGPGTGKYSRPNSSNDLTLIPSPAYSFPKEKRAFKLTFNEKTPDHLFCPLREHFPSVIIGQKFKTYYKFKTPSPTQYLAERSKDFLKPTIPFGSFGKEQRFSKAY